MNSVVMKGRFVFLALFLITQSAVAEEPDERHDDGPVVTSATGYSYVDRLTQLEEDLIAQGLYVPEGKDEPLSRMAQFKKPSKEAMELIAINLKSLNASERRRPFVDPIEDITVSPIPRPVDFALVNDNCMGDPICPATPSKFRTADGSCNSITIPNLGRSMTIYRRWLGPDYSNGQDAPRLATNGNPLPSARHVSNIVFRQTTSPDPPIRTVTSSLMQFGQLINHDMEATNQFAFTVSRYSSGIKCCSAKNTFLNPSSVHPACMSILIPPGDVLLSSTPTANCMSFVRSLTGPRISCDQQPTHVAEQLNSNTHWLDGSTIYGSTLAVMNSLRTFSGGLLRMTADTTADGRPRSMLPTSPGTCTRGPCYIAGDPRATEHPQLAVMHTIWAREHNRVARQLAALNKAWNDETLFQEARRIVIAELQHITYNEFLPTLLGKATMDKYGLNPSPLSTYASMGTGVNNGPISNEFATAAFRMGHSLVPDRVLLFDENGVQLPSSFNLRDFFNDASQLANDKHFFDNAIRGLVTQPSQSVDQAVGDALWRELFKAATEQFGLDVVAFNLQRGRDHGLPSYNVYRQKCGFSKLTSFDQLWNSALVGPGQPMTEPIVATWLSQSYTSVDDIDLFAGLVAEMAPRPVTATSGVVGPTAACLIGENFASLKNSDNYFYERNRSPNLFSLAQLNSIKRTSLARIYCDNNDGSVLRMQAKAFNVPDAATNPKVLCSSIPSVDLRLWSSSRFFVTPDKELIPFDKPPFNRPPFDRPVPIEA